MLKSILTLVLLIVAATGCNVQKIPQESNQRGDSMPNQISIHLTVNGHEAPATQPAAKVDPLADTPGPGFAHATTTTTTTINITTAATGSQTHGGEQTATPGPITNTPTVNPNVPINLTPGSGASLPGITK